MIDIVLFALWPLLAGLTIDWGFVIANLKYQASMTKREGWEA